MNIHFSSRPCGAAVRRSCLLVLAGAGMTIATARAEQPVEQPISLVATQHQLARIASDAPVGQLNFTVDAGATQLDFDIGSPARNLVVAIAGPAGQQITAATIGGFGGTYSVLPASGTAPDGPMIYPLSTAGIRYRFQLPTLGPGAYMVRAMATGLAEQLPVIGQLQTDSPVTAQLMFTDPVGTVGRRAVLCAAVIDAAAPVADASVTAHVLDPLQQVTVLTLLDDGGEVDGTAGDGLYCAAFTPSAPGRHAALADIRADAGAGPVRRDAAAELAVEGARASFTGPFSDSGTDTDGDGRFDYVALLADVDVVVAGTYRALATLRTGGGVAFKGTFDQVLAAGSGRVEVRLDGLQLQALREDGPYTVERIDLVFLESGGAHLADVLEAPGTTGAYLLSQLEREGIMLAGGTTDAGIDNNGNGLFDQLRIGIGIDVQAAGVYQFSARLTDRDGRPIELAASSVQLPAGAGMLPLLFDGRRIGMHGIDGPYLLDSFLIHGAGAALTESGEVARTAAYRHDQFDAATANPADVNGDGQVDCADIALIRTGFGRRTGQPGFDPRTDVVADGVIDARDLALVAMALPIGTQCR